MPNKTAADKARLTNELSIRRRQAKRITADIKTRRKRLKAVRARAKKVRAKLIKLNNPGPRVYGNRVTGGTPRERVVAAALKAAELDSKGIRKSFYSQSGSYRVDRGITGEPVGYRSDCSQWVTSIYWSAGLKDPNGKAFAWGYTGTLAENGHEIAGRNAKPGDLVIWDPWGFAGHVEILIDPSTGATVGHGSAPVDKGNVSDFSYKPGGPRYFTYL